MIASRPYIPKGIIRSPDKTIAVGLARRCLMVKEVANAKIGKAKLRVELTK
jgi:hypothetical protein